MNIAPWDCGKVGEKFLKGTQHTQSMQIWQGVSLSAAIPLNVKRAKKATTTLRNEITLKITPAFLLQFLQVEKLLDLRNL